MYNFFNGNGNRRLLDSQVLNRVFNKLSETGAATSSSAGRYSLTVLVLVAVIAIT